MVDNTLPDFEKPPIVEVVSGIQFKSIKDLTGPNLSLLGEKFKTEYPAVKEVLPLAPVLESYDDASEREMASFDHMFGLTRYWFETTDSNGLIQVQKDRFLHNWRKEKDSDKYPHYNYVIGKFRSSLEVFEAFLDEKKIGKVQLTQLELTYVNHILKGEGWETFDDLGNISRTYYGVETKGDFYRIQRRSTGKQALECLDRRVDCTYRLGWVSEKPTKCQLFF